MFSRRKASSVVKTKYPWYYGSEDSAACLQKILCNAGVATNLDVELGSEFYSFKYAALCSSTLVADCTHADEEGYALDCVNTAHRNNLSCICVFDWDDPYKIAGMLQSKTRIYARKCRIEEIDQKTANAFLKMYHLQGSAKGQTCCLGMYLNGELVCTMTFGKPRYNKRYEWEPIRLCFHPKYTVVGASERMFKHFVNLKRPSSVLSYCDNSKFAGLVYRRLGMNLVSLSAPSKHWYSDRGCERSPHITNNFLLQHGYDQIFNEHYGKGTSNEELIMKRGYKPLYDAGQMTFEWYNN